MKRDMAFFKDGSGTDGKVLHASVTAIEFTLPNGDFLAFFAMRTNRAIRPTAIFNVKPSRFLIRKHFKKLESADRCIFHGFLPQFFKSSFTFILKQGRFSFKIRQSSKGNLLHGKNNNRQKAKN
jgi:hypothetical protein